MIRLVLRLSVVGAGLAWLIDRYLASRDPGPPEPIRTMVVIDAPVDRVWNVLTDIEGQPRWMDDMKAVRILTRPPIGVGTRAEGDIRILGIGVVDPITITEFDPPRRFAVRHEGLFNGTGIVELEAGADGTTTIARWEETIMPPYLPHLGGLVMAPILERIFQRDLANLRRLIETGARRG